MLEKPIFSICLDHNAVYLQYFNKVLTFKRILALPGKHTNVHVVKNAQFLLHGVELAIIYSHSDFT